MKNTTRIISLLIVIFSVCMILASCAAPVVQNPQPLSTEAVYQMAKLSGYTGSLEEFIEEFKGDNGAPGENGKDGVGIADILLDSDGSLIMTLTNGREINCGKIVVNIDSETAIGIGDNGNWYINGEDTGKSASGKNGTSWLTGDTNPKESQGNNGDLYFNSKTCDVFQKQSGAWVVIANIKGDGTIVNEGDRVDITVTEDESGKFAAAKALMSAVSIEAIYNVGTTRQYASTGSGVIYKLDKDAGDAYIITNFHVVYDANAFTANKISDNIGLYLYGMEFSDYRVSAQYIGGAMTYDIAILKVTDSDIIRKSAATEVELADSSAVRVLDTAIAVGNPASGGISATKGSVSVESQNIEMVAPDNKSVIEFRVMRIDTPVNNGNSGGGLFDMKGRLIGIVNAKEKDTSIENMGYAIPSNLAVYVSDNIIRNCDGSSNEKAIKCRLGLRIAVGSANAEYDSETGILTRVQTSVISDIETGSVAETVFMVDDIILSFEIDGVTYPVNYYYDGSEILLNVTKTSELFVNVKRGGEPLRVHVPITEENFVSVP